MSAAAKIPSGEGRILGVDFGDVRMGLSRSDPGRCFASPWKVVAYKGTFKRAAHLVVEAAAEGEVVGIVVGMPRSMDGSYTGKAEQVPFPFLTVLNGFSVTRGDNTYPFHSLAAAFFNNLLHGFRRDGEDGQVRGFRKRPDLSVGADTVNLTSPMVDRIDPPGIGSGKEAGHDKRTPRPRAFRGTDDRYGLRF